MLLIAGGFVLGEAFCLQGAAAMELAAAAVLALVCCGVFCVLKQAVRRVGKGKPGPEKKEKGRSLRVRLLPVLVLVLSAAAGAWRAGGARAEEEACMASALDGREVRCEGIVKSLVRKEKSWEAVLEPEMLEVREDPAVSGEVPPETGEVLVDSGENLAASGENLAASGENLAASSEILTASDENLTASGEMLTASVGVRTGKRLLVYIDSGENSRPRIGARIRVEGRLEAFEPARNPGQFDFRDYYRAKKLFYRMSAEGIEPLDGFCDWLGEALFRAADHAGKVLEQIAPPEAAGIFKAALLGDKTGMDEEILLLYRKNGVAHLLAISGLHLSLISMAIYGGLRKSGLGYGLAGLIGGTALFWYARMTGMAPSIQRAAVMAAAGYLAAYLGRTYDLLSALSFAALLLCWDNPYAMTQAGVQLSFAAVFGIGAAAPLLAETSWSDETETPRRAEASRGDGAETPRRAESFCPAGKPGRKGGGIHSFRQALAVSLGMQLLTAPLVLYHFFEIPLYGMLLNFVVVPLMGIVLFSGAAGILLGSLHYGVGRFAAGSGCLILAFYRQLCEWFMRLPGANLVMGRPALWQIGLYYGLLAGVLLLKCSGILRKRTMLRAACLMAFLLPLPVRGLQVTFLDVGQGDGICMETSSGVILVDGGSSDERSLFEDVLEPFLKSRGITAVDYAVVSHGDQDHISGLKELLKPEGDIAVSNLVLPAAGRGDEAYRVLEEAARDCGTQVLWMAAGDRLKMGKLSAECLYPGKGSAEALAGTIPEDGGNAGYGYKDAEDRNEHSLVLRVSFGRFAMLLTGDMTGEGEQKLLSSANPPETVHVLKVAHHGSRTATSSAWLEALHPAWAVISCGRENRYGHPHQEVLDALEKQGTAVWLTSRSGAVMFDTDGEKIRWKEFTGERQNGANSAQ